MKEKFDHGNVRQKEPNAKGTHKQAKKNASCR